MHKAALHVPGQKGAAIVAVKALKPHLHMSQSDVDLFVRESQVLSRVSHRQARFALSCFVCVHADAETAYASL